MYHFVCNDPTITDMYVGHTTHFSERKANHKSCCSNENDKCYQLKLYKNIRDNGGWENWKMVPLEEYPCETSMQARIREQYWIGQLQSKLNMCNAYTELKGPEYDKQYYTDNREELKQYFKQYRTKHREELNQKFTCECGGKYTHNNKSTHLKTQKHINFLS